MPDCRYQLVGMVFEDGKHFGNGDIPDVFFSPQKIHIHTIYGWFPRYQEATPMRQQPIGHHRALLDVAPLHRRGTWHACRKYLWMGNTLFSLKRLQFMKHTNPNWIPFNETLVHWVDVWWFVLITNPKSLKCSSPQTCSSLYRHHRVAGVTAAKVATKDSNRKRGAVKVRENKGKKI